MEQSQLQKEFSTVFFKIVTFLFECGGVSEGHFFHHKEKTDNE